MFRVQAARVAQGKSSRNRRDIVFLVRGNKQYNGSFNPQAAGDGSISFGLEDFGFGSNRQYGISEQYENFEIYQNARFGQRFYGD